MANESASKTFAVAALLAVVCSALVASSAVLLRPRQAKNKDIDRKRNILEAAGLYQEGKSVEEQFKRFAIEVVDLDTGEFVDSIDAVTFDQRDAAKSVDGGVAIPPGEDLAGLKRRSRHALVYIARDDAGRLLQLILPVRGRGLWSTLYGYIALGSDLSTIGGFSIYEHGETPGLGGEVDNPRWKAQWVGKKAFGEDGEIEIEVLKGPVQPNSANKEHEIDGLAGATITTRGVDAILRYWLGENGFGPLIERLQANQGENNG